MRRNLPRDRLRRFVSLSAARAIGVCAACCVTPTGGPDRPRYLRTEQDDSDGGEAPRLEVMADEQYEPLARVMALEAACQAGVSEFDARLALGMYPAGAPAAHR